jgi:PAS domain S-box-containing protein
MHTTLERAPMPLMLVDSDGTIAYAPSSIDDFGYVTEELIGHRLLDFAHPDDRELLGSLLELPRRGERDGSTIDMRWRQRDESYAHVEIAIRACGDPPAPFAGGVVVGLRSLP